MGKKTKKPVPVREESLAATTVVATRDYATLWGGLAVALITFALYANTLGNGYVWDDNVHAMVPKTLAELPGEIFSELRGHEGGRYYRPGIGIFFLLTVKLFGNGPWGFHLVNVCIHTAVALMAYLVVARLLRECGRGESLRPPLLAAATALLFSAHPIHSESVAWVSGITDPACSLFMLLSFYCYLRSGEEGSGARHRWFYVLSLAALLYATLCKEIGVTLPLLLIAYDYAFQRASFTSPRYLLRLLPFFLVVALFLALRSHALSSLALGGQNQGILLETGTGAGLDNAGYLINTLPLFMRYLAKLLVPIHLSAYYGYKPIASLLTPVGLAALATAAGYALLTWYAVKRDRVLFFPLALLVIPLLPALHFRGTGLTAFADRYLYLPSLGFVLLLAMLVAAAAAARPRLHALILLAGIVLFSGYATATVIRNGVWKNNHALWTDTVAKYPDTVFPRFSLAHTLKSAGRISEAVEQYRAAIRLNPGYVSAHVNLGNIYAEQGDLIGASRELQTAVSLAPNLADAWYNLGAIYLRMREPAKAVPQFTRVLALRPDYASAHDNMGIALLSTGAREQALEHFRHAVRLEPANAQFRSHLELAARR
jgi:tetratricopeptide (TPR) repeat protein